MECPLCLEQYESLGKDQEHLPRILKECAHTFCTGCLAAMLSRVAEPVVACPLCRVRTVLSSSDVNEIRPNYALLDQLSGATSSSSSSSSPSSSSPAISTTTRSQSDPHIELVNTELSQLIAGGSVIVTTPIDQPPSGGSLGAIIEACRASDIDITEHVAHAPVHFTSASGIEIACITADWYSHLPQYDVRTFPFECLWIVRLPSAYTIATLRSLYTLVGGIFNRIVDAGRGRVSTVLFGVFQSVTALDCLEELLSLHRGYAASCLVDQSLPPLASMTIYLRDAAVTEQLRARLHSTDKPAARASELTAHIGAIGACAANVPGSATLQHLLVDLRTACTWGHAWPVCGRGRAIAECLVRILDHSDKNPNGAVVRELAAQGLIPADLVESYNTLCRLGNAALHVDGPGVSDQDAVATVRAVLRILSDPEQIVVVTRELKSPSATSASEARHVATVRADWTCACGFVNFASRTVCMTCSTPKKAGSATASTSRTAAAVATTPVSAARNDWTCSCGFVNFASRTVCKSCSAQKAAPHAPVPTAPIASSLSEAKADWTCACGMLNFAFRASCYACGNVKGTPIRDPSEVEYVWHCRNCRFPNMLRTVCLECQTPRDPSVAHTATSTTALPTSKPGDWICACGTSNFASRTDCFGCHRQKGVAFVPSSSSSSPATKPGDWTCVCGTSNFASRTECFGCRRQKSAASPPVAHPAVATTAATASSKPGDWTCVCGTSNFSSRTECFGCRRAKGSSAVSATSSAPSPAPTGTQKPGDWMCSCGSNNFASRSECFSCRRRRPGFASASQAPKAGDWLCSCSKMNFASRSICFGCKQPRS